MPELEMYPLDAKTLASGNASPYDKYELQPEPLSEERMLPLTERLAFAMSQFWGSVPQSVKTLFF